MKRLSASFHYVIVFMALGCSATASLAGDDGPGLEWHGQTTYVRQFKPSFDAAYSGPKSLATNREYAYSWTSTLFIGARLGPGWEAYLDPEATQGAPLSQLQGLGGFSNGESQRTAGPILALQ